MELLERNGGRARGDFHVDDLGLNTDEYDDDEDDTSDAGREVALRVRERKRERERPDT